MVRNMNENCSVVDLIWIKCVLPSIYIFYKYFINHFQYTPINCESDFCDNNMKLDDLNGQIWNCE